MKNVYVGNERTLRRKIREAALAVRLEQRKSKDEILTDYLNVLYLGNSTYGVQAASQLLLRRRGAGPRPRAPGAAGRRDPVLALARASMLAGIAPAPSVWNPVRDFAQARARQKYTLNQMVVGGLHHLRSRRARRSGREAAVVPKQVTPPEPPSTAPEYADIVNAQLQEQFAERRRDQLVRGGLRVRTAARHRPAGGRHPRRRARCCPTRTTRRPRSSPSTSAAATSRR